MLKQISLAVVILSFCSTSVFAQDIFVSFGQGADARTSMDVTVTGAEGTSGTAFVYVDQPFQFDAFDLDFSTSDDSVIQLTGAMVPNSIINPGFFYSLRWDVDPIAELDPGSTTSGRMFAVSILEFGIEPDFTTIDEDFDVEANAFLLGTIEYDIVGVGTADITLTPVSFGTNEDFGSLLFPSVGNGSLTVLPLAVPESSTMGILALGLVGFVARRRR